MAFEALRMLKLWTFLDILIHLFYLGFCYEPKPPNLSKKNETKQFKTNCRTRMQYNNNGKRSCGFKLLSKALSRDLLSVLTLI